MSVIPLSRHRGVFWAQFGHFRTRKVLEAELPIERLDEVKGGDSRGRPRTTWRVLRISSDQGYRRCPRWDMEDAARETHIWASSPTTVRFASRPKGFISADRLGRFREVPEM